MMYSREDTLAARHYLYSLFQSIFGGEPTEDSLALWQADLTEKCLPFCNVPSASFLTALKSTPLQTLQQAYMVNFIGPGKLPVLPWESAIAGDERVLFQKQTLEVRQAYKAAGFTPAMGHHVADDHLALEFGFLGALAGKMLEAHKDEEKEVSQLAKTSLSFIENHLGYWLPSYTKAMEKHDSLGFYTIAAQAAHDFVKQDRQQLQKFI